MKFIITNLLVLITSVSLKIFLFSTSNFLPYDSLGDTDTLNISVLIFLILLTLISFFDLLIFGVVHIVRKNEVENRIKAIVAIRYSLLISLGTLVVFTLNYFNILDWVWGLTILFVVFIASIIV